MPHASVGQITQRAFVPAEENAGTHEQAFGLARQQMEREGHSESGERRGRLLKSSGRRACGGLVCSVRAGTSSRLGDLRQRESAVPWVIRCDGDAALLPFSPLAQRWMVSYQQDMLAL